MKQFFIPFVICGLMALSSCGSGDDPQPDTTGPTDTTDTGNGGAGVKDPSILDGDYRFLITARASHDNVREPSYILQVGHVNAGSIRLNQGGWQADQGNTTADGSIWFYPDNKAAYLFEYRQGPSYVTSFHLDADNNFVKGADEYLIPDGSGTFGTFGNQMVTINNSYIAGVLHSTFTFFDPDTGEATAKTIRTENITGSNENVQHQFSGIVGVDDKFYSSICIPGRKDSVWVFEFDKDLNYRIIGDDRIAYSSGRFRSIYFGQMDTDDKGNLYVFSSSFEKDTPQPSGALRINKGAGEFDKDYYFNIEALTGGRAVYKVWHITGDYFLIQTYTGTEKSQAQPDIKKLAIANMTEKTLNWVSGIPGEHIVSRIGNSLCVHEGKILVPITTDDDSPYIYTIDPVTGRASQGLKIVAGSVIAIGKLNH